MGFRVDLVNVIREELMVLLGAISRTFRSLFVRCLLGLCSDVASFCGTEPRVYQSHLQVVRGECKLPKLKGPCRLQLIFDNTHSMVTISTANYR